MPMMDSDQQSTWDYLYRCQVNGQTVHYVREAKEQYLGQDHWKLRDALGLQPGQKICLVGGGYGWVAEDWGAAGLSVTVCDTSAYIQANKTSQSTVQVLNESGLSVQSRRNLLTVAGLPQNGKFDWIITEDVLPMLTDNECLPLGSECRKFGLNVAHWVSVKEAGNFAPLNWKTLAEWKALMTPDKVVKRGTSEVL